jgi:hypothetical protein
MAARGEVVELIGMETESSIGYKVEGDDADRCTSKEKHRCEAGMLLARQSVRAERHRREGSSRRGRG